MLLAEEFDDTDDPHMTYRDYPATVFSGAPSPQPGSATGTTSFDVHRSATASPISPHIMGLRASESGSIFREAVWPPPGEASRFVDPMLQGSSQVNLTKIVDDVMGPSPTESEGPKPDPPLFGPASHIRGGSGSTTTPSASASQVSLHRDPFRTPPPTAYPHTRNASSMSLTSIARHTPSPSWDTTPGSPTGMAVGGGGGVLFVTNGVPGSPSVATPPRNWLERSPKAWNGDGHSRKGSTDDNDGGGGVGTAL
ncbi:hypothetical protein BXZ70DRAFT_471694 [Cristinia sonorae]|uniref:Uncharacterized protein n=1 Tax=Cristinia sonorae TaxID=1940300 RepID=A0A8K0UIG8_9AGAR|nr:hypothetical protein BXZ70DRAFT_471694 [Cristinia sonorae]